MQARLFSTTIFTINGFLSIPDSVVKITFILFCDSAQSIINQLIKKLKLPITEKLKAYMAKTKKGASPLYHIHKTGDH